ncbi:MAG: TerC family protein [Fimbriimonadaceae bacterium]|nr:TerC family protein [Fimbriimonadaceae bacterium]
MDLVALLSNPQTWIAFFTLLVLELVLGVDNVIFISILSGKLPEHQRKKAFQIGLSLALVLRLALLFSIFWIMQLDKTLFTLPFLGAINEKAADITGKDLVLLAGGLFLIWKAVKEIHEKLEGEAHERTIGEVTFTSVIVQILVLDLVFSIDSVITAVGMVREVSVMVAAIVIAVLVMLTIAQTLADFVQKHPTVKMLALAFLVLIGVTLLAEGTGNKIPKGYIYFSMAFSVAVEMLNLRMKSKKQAVKLHNRFEDGNGPS